MQPSQLPAAACAALLSSLLPCFAQDSVAKTPSLPGDCTSPFDDSSASGGSEQTDTFVVDLTAFRTSWGTTFALGPALKTSKVPLQFTGCLVSSSGVSRRALTNTAFAASSYSVWKGAGYGVNNDPVLHDAPSSISTSGFKGVRQAVAVTEFGAATYNGVIGGLIDIHPSAPTRLYVKRVVAGINSCDGTANASQFGLGSIDAAGTLLFRADDFGVNGGGTACPTLTNLVDDNIFKVRIASRNGAIQNVISGDFVGGGLFDLGTNTTEWLVRSNPTITNTPGIATGGLYVGTSSGSQYLRGTTFGAITSDSTHLAAGVSDHRGNVGYTSRNFSFLVSSNGVCGVVGTDASGNTTRLNVWGINAAGAVTGTAGLVLPGVVSDPTTGATNLGGVNEFNNYKSQVSFRGGNGQVAVCVDQAGRLLAAAAVDHPTEPAGASNQDKNYIAVARTTTAGATTWVMAAYNDGTSGGGGTGKPILDGPGGSVIGRLIPLSAITGGTPNGPSISSPMFDCVGNVWFYSAVELFTGPLAGMHTGLLRAVYSPATFSYELELVLHTGQRFNGSNSLLTYEMDFLQIADSNSVASSSPWSQNMVEDAHLGGSSAGLQTRDPRTLGGLAVPATLLYDWNSDGTFSDTVTDPLSPDTSYNVILYVGYPGFDIRPTPPHGPKNPI